MKFRLSDNKSWATEFEAEDEAVFCREFPAALDLCRGRVVSLHKGGSPVMGDDTQWHNVGNIQMGVFYDGKSAQEHGGQYELRGYGFQFLSISPEHPLSELVWAIANDRTLLGTIVPLMDMRPKRSPEQIELNKLFLEMIRIANCAGHLREFCPGKVRHAEDSERQLIKLAREYAILAKQHKPDTDWAHWAKYSERHAPYSVVTAVLDAAGVTVSDPAPVMTLLRQELDDIFATREKWSAKLQEEMDRVVSGVRDILASGDLCNDASLPQISVGEWTLIAWDDNRLCLGSKDLVAAGDMGDPTYHTECPPFKAPRSDRVKAARALPELIQKLIEALKAENEEQRDACEALRMMIDPKYTDQLSPC